MRYFKAVICLLAIHSSLTGCEPRLGIRGNLPDPELVARLEIGQTKRDEVFQLLGSPSTTALFDLETWIYFYERTETQAFFKPEILQRNVLVIKFSDTGILAGMQGLGLDSSNTVEPIERTTPTAGNEVTVMEQIIGNIGRFNKSSD